MERQRVVPKVGRRREALNNLERLLQSSKQKYKADVEAESFIK